MTRREFSSIASTYQRLRGLKPENMDMWMNFIITHGNLKAKDRILDLGCGTGTFAVPLAEKGLEVHGLDITEDMLRAAQRSDLGRTVQWCVGDAENPPFQDESFHASFLSMVVEHVENRARLFKELYRVLKDNGTCFIRMAANDILMKIDFYHFFPQCLADDLRVCPDAEEVVEYLEEAGFSDIRSLKMTEKNQTSPMRRLEQVAGKAFSGLRTLSESDFQKGLREYKRYVETLSNPHRLEDLELTLVVGTRM